MMFIHHINDNSREMSGDYIGHEQTKVQIGILDE